MNSTNRPFSKILRCGIGVITAAVFLPAIAVQPLTQPGPINPRADHVERWNWFVHALYAFHLKRIADHSVRTEERLGGYAGKPGFYREVTYFDKDTGTLISRLQWEREKPDLLHSIEVYVYDGAGRVIRDYGAWFLTHSRTAPQATIINLYVYNDGLKAMRQFDATDNRLFERCNGEYKGKNVDIELWEDEIIRLAGEPKTVMTSKVYAACFRGLPAKSADKYLTPQ